MPKMKTSRAAAKRFKTTGTGKVRRNKAYKSHILTKKSTKRKRNLRQVNYYRCYKRKEHEEEFYHIYKIWQESIEGGIK